MNVNRLSVALAASLFVVPLCAAERRRAAAPILVPRATRVFMVILENEAGSATTDQPFLHRLAARGAYLSNYHGLTHPSQPNYIALFAGSAYGIADDVPVTIDVPHLGDLLEARGLSWKTYAENLPSPCFLGASAGSQKTGTYVRRHDPFIEFANVQKNPQRCSTHIVNAVQLDSDIAAGTLPSFSLYIPNNQNNGHDSSLAAADRWLNSRFSELLDDPRFNTDVLFIVTFDESDGRSENLVSTFLAGPMVRPGVESDEYYDHYDMLRTIEEIFHTGTLEKHDKTARMIRGIWY